MSDRCAALIKDILRKDNSASEWIELQERFNSFIATATDEDRQALEESGSGEMLYMICSGLNAEVNRR